MWVGKLSQDPIAHKAVGFFNLRIQMIKSEIPKTIATVERIRDILLTAGIRSDADDAQLQRICKQIDDLYQELQKVLR